MKSFYLKIVVCLLAFTALIGAGKFIHPVLADGTCTVTSVQLSTIASPSDYQSIGQKTESTTYADPTHPGKTVDYWPSWYNNSITLPVTITIATSGCVHQTLYATLLLRDSLVATTGTPAQALTDKQLVVPDDGTLTVSMNAGDGECTKQLWGTPDCTAFVMVAQTPHDYTETGGSISPNADAFVSKGTDFGELRYDCDGVTCSGRDWSYVTDNSYVAPNTANVTGNGQNNGGADPASACPQGGNCYAFFSGFASALGEGIGGKLASISSSMTDFGSLVNAIIAFGIGIGGVLAVAMIVYEGILYMRTDNVTTKGNARSRIAKTVAGFLLLLCVYVLLRTINPDLLNLSPGINAVNLNQSYLTSPDVQVSGTGTGIPNPAGATTTSTGRVSVTSIASDLNQWNSLLAASSAKYGVDCTLMKAIMTQESRGQANATSPVGAIGLMQVMPANFQGVSGSSLTDPATNIDAGVLVYSNFAKNPCLTGTGWSSSPDCTTSNNKFSVAAYNGGYWTNGKDTSCGGTETKWECGKEGLSAQTNSYVPTVLGYYSDLETAGMTCGN